VWAGAVITVSDIEWRPEARAMIKRLDELGLSRLVYARTGGAYMAGFANKRMQKWIKGRKQLQYEAGHFWELPWWDEIGRPKVQELAEVYERKMLDNIAFLDDIRDTEERIKWAIADKLPTTGTGWKRPLHNREHWGRNLPMYRRRIETAIEQGAENWIEAVEHFPRESVRIRTSADFRGITHGSRDDAEVTAWTDMDRQEITSIVRGVTTDEQSACSNSWLTDRAWQRSVFGRTIPPRWLNPHDADAYVATMIYPPATCNFEADIVSLDLDAGWESKPPTVIERDDHLEWQMAKDSIAFGADQVTYRGIFLEAGPRLMAFKLSGKPDTMVDYNISYGHGIYWECREAGIDLLSVTQIGDDLSIRIRQDQVPEFMARLGPYVRAKGMHGNLTFRLGRNLFFKDPDHVVTFVSPRALKSVPSPQELAGLPKLQQGMANEFAVSEEAREQIDQFWKLYPEMVFFEGTTTEWKDIVRKVYREATVNLANYGISEWQKYFIKEGDEEAVEA